MSTPRPQALVVTALRLERDAVVAQLSDVHPSGLEQGTQFDVGTLSGDAGQWEVSVVQVGPGNLHATAETTRMLDAIDPDVVLFVGVAAGVKDVTLGDVVVARKVADLHSGKAAEPFEARPVVLEPDYRLLQLAGAVSRDESWRDRVPANATDAAGKAVIGPVGASQQVVVDRDAEVWKVTARHYSDTIAFDMESAGFMRAAQHSPAAALVVRGISDLGVGKSGEGDEEWQPRAAARAAAFACEVLSRARRRPRRDAPPVASNLPPVSGGFTGRRSEFEALGRRPRADVLRAEEPRMVVLHGLGGAGKTRLALEYARRARGNLAWFVSGTRELAAIASMAELARELGLSEAEEADQAAAAEAARRHLEETSGWLLIVDDAAGALEPRILPQRGDGLILVTSQRATGWRAHGEPVAIGVLPRPDAIALLADRSGDRDQVAADALAEALGDLPLALAQAGAYADAMSIGLSDYLERFSAAASDLLDQEAPLDHEQTVAATWGLAFEQVAEDWPAWIVLVCTAFCAPIALPRDVFRAGALENSPFVDDDGVLVLDQAVGALLRFSLVNADAESVVLHRLVGHVLRDGIDPETGASWLRATQILLEQSFPLDVEIPALWERCDLLLPHALAAAGFAAEWETEDDATAALLYRVGRYLRTRYRLAEAETAFRRSVELKLAVEGGGTDAAAGLSELGGILRDRGQLTDAEGNLRAALDILGEIDAGPVEHARVLLNLGSVVRRLDRHDEAFQILDEALAMLEAELGDDNPELITALVNSANALNDGPEAIRRLERALDLGRRHLGEAHPDVALIASNLATQRGSAGDVSGAAELGEAALASYEGAFGADYPGLARVLVNAAASDLLRGDGASAKTRLERALTLDMEVHGSEHPDVSRTLVDLAKAERMLGNHSAAREAAERAVAAAGDSDAGPAGPRIEALLHLADVLRHADADLDVAEAAARSALALARETLDVRAAQTAFALRTLGTVLRVRAEETGSGELARESYVLQTEAPDILAECRGPRSADVCSTMGNIGNLLSSVVGRQDEAIALLTDAVELAAEVWGTESRDYASQLMNLGSAYEDAGDTKRALELAAQACEIDPALLPSKPVD